jgi:hypothetical protein
MQMLTLPPWAFAVWLATFLVGVVAGRYYERHTLYKESTMRKVVTVYNAWYYRRAPALVTGVAVIALIGIWLAAAATITNGQQDRRADARDTAVQRCFDRWADAQSASTSAVREASVTKDQATAEKDAANRRFNKALNDEGQAFKTLVRKILSQSVEPVDVKRLYDTLDARDRLGKDVEVAQAKLAKAQRKLDRARKDNPVPEAPSTFCSVKP